MGLFDKVKNRFGVDDEDYDTMEIDELEDQDDLNDDKSENKVSFQPSKTISMPQNEKKVSISSLPQLQVVLVKPERFEDAIDIADSLSEKKTVVLNLESAEKDVSRRLVDFLSGVAYAYHGNVQKIANQTFLITPYDVDISGIGLIDDLSSHDDVY
jgi:cell division inhibitor SepF